MILNITYILVSLYRNLTPALAQKLLFQRNPSCLPAWHCAQPFFYLPYSPAPTVAYSLISHLLCERMFPSYCDRQRGLQCQLG